jgi:predicted transcriptional regulator
MPENGAISKLYFSEFVELLTYEVLYSKTATINQRGELLASSFSKRDHLQIIAEILDLCLEPRVKTRIMYKVSLSYNMLQNYLNYLQKLDLVALIHSKKKYATTEKGLRFLQKWIGIQQILREKSDSSFFDPLSFTDNQRLALIARRL